MNNTSELREEYQARGEEEEKGGGGERRGNDYQMVFYYCAAAATAAAAAAAVSLKENTTQCKNSNMWLLSSGSVLWSSWKLSQSRKRELRVLSVIVI